MSETAIHLENVRVGYGRRRVLDGLDLRVERGTVNGLLGLNGSGKTTLMRLLNGLLPPSGGTVRVLGLDPWRQRVALQRRLAFMPEHPALYDDLDAGSFLRFCRRLHPAFDLVGARDRLEALGVPLGTRLGRLSRGQRGLVSLSAALARRAEVLLLDDPTLGLDLPARRNLYRTILEDLAERDTAVLFATHQPAEVEGILTHVAFLRDGRIVAGGPLDELKRARAGEATAPDLEELTFQILGGQDAA
ncbi:MAG: ABC transporter ATP-binding protein [Acidobacteria bacterium]|nr:ABC transporter ATP-binding protein [Acidobacteriota bacterium]